MLSRTFLRAFYKIICPFFLSLCSIYNKFLKLKRYNISFISVKKYYKNDNFLVRRQILLYF